MKELIKEAMEFIQHNPEKAKFIDHILKWDEETTIAFKLAYSLYKEKYK